MKRFSAGLIFLSIIMLTGCYVENINTSNDFKKLSYYVDSYITQDNVVQSQTKVQYQYNGQGALLKYTVSSFNSKSAKFEEERYFELTYSGNLVSEMKAYVINETVPYIEYTYQYLQNGNISKIGENNHSAGITSEANFTYSDLDSSVKVVFTFSNGQSFEYEFNYAGQNIISDLTTKGSEICNNGSYTYDQMNNPFKDLGYYDYSLNTLSANNRVTENVNYLHCAFPTLIPISYSYEYNTEGYPTVATTTFSTDNYKQKREYFYR